MSVWLCIPSAAPSQKVNEVLSEWTRRGYRTAIFRDKGAESVEAELVFHEDYTGYAAAVNYLCRMVAEWDSDAEWFVTGGDDVHPDQDRHAHDIAKECSIYFGGTFGIMEPTGDRWLVDESGKCSSERVCIAPWIGREWVEHGYGGDGPLHDGYYHFYADEELKLVAEKLGMLWQRRDLIQYHDNWQRVEGRPRPAYLEKAVVTNPSDRMKFEGRKALGFPGHQPK